MPKTIPVALAAILTMAAGSAAVAAPADNALARNEVVMSLRHLDLATVGGQRALAIRMDQAARDVCGDRLSTIHLSLEAQSRQCRAEVKADIRARIESKVAAAGRAVARPVLIASR